MTARQLALPLGAAPHYTAAGFIAAPCNEAALAWLDRTEAWPEGRLALWGEPGVGKSHALHRWAERAGAAVLSGPRLRGLPAPVGRGAAVDDADLCGDPPALLHFINAMRESGVPLLLAGRAPPAHWPVALPDLASRLRATTAVRLDAADDALLRALLARLFAERQLAVAAPVQEYLLARLPRDGGSLREAVARLDHAALAAGIGIGRALAAEVIAEMDREAAPPPLAGGGWGEGAAATTVRGSAPIPPRTSPAKGGEARGLHVSPYANPSAGV